MSDNTNHLNMVPVKPSQAKRMLAKYLKARRVPMIHGSPGIGKSDIIRQVAEEFDLFVIDIRLAQCDPTDLLGFPQVQNGKAGYVPMNTFPLEGDPLPINPKTGKPYSGWLIFFDEFNACAKAVQSAAFKIVLERMVGIWKLHERVLMAAAGNLATDNGIVEELSTPMQSRLVHMLLVPDLEEFLDWAEDHKFDRRIISYLRFKPGALHDFRPDHADATFACPRTWAFADSILKVTDEGDEDRQALLGGAITRGYASELMDFFLLHSQIPKISDIRKDPTGITVPADLGILWAVTDSIAHHADKDNLEDLMKFVERIPMEFQAVCLRSIIKRKKELLTHKTIQHWVAEKGPKLFGQTGMRS